MSEFHRVENFDPSSYTVLVADDELGRQLFADLLENRGFRVVTASDAEGVLGSLDNADIVVLDTQLAGADGWDICRKVKIREPLTPVVMVTHRKGPDDVVRTFAAGADDYVAKPFHVAELFARVEARLRISAAERALLKANEELADLANKNYTAYDELKRELGTPDANTLRLQFAFPPPVRAACEQYLVYFVQFLENLGIEATADLEHEAGKVLFSVTPASGEEALIKVQRALDIYLHLPESPAFETMQAADPHLQVLQANIQHLKGQLLLATALVQAKNETIRHLEARVPEHAGSFGPSLIAASVVSTSNPAVSPKSDEDILGGAVSLTRFEGPGFSINVGNIWRRLSDYVNRVD